MEWQAVRHHDTEVIYHMGRRVNEEASMAAGAIDGYSSELRNLRCTTRGRGARRSQEEAVGRNAGESEPLTPEASATVSQNLSLPVARNPKPPLMLPRPDADTCVNRVVPLLSRACP